MWNIQDQILSHHGWLNTWVTPILDKMEANFTLLQNRPKVSEKAETSCKQQIELYVKCVFCQKKKTVRLFFGVGTVAPK